MLSIDLNNKVAIVTGADGGIGKGIVEALAKSGAVVFAACRNLENAKQVSAEFKEFGVLSIQVDVTKQESVEKMASDVVRKFGRIDILVNNAGVVAAPGWEGREEQTDRDWIINYEVNLRGLARVTDALAIHMKEKKYGKIINISSTAARGGNKSHIPSSYGATKAAVLNLTQTQALELAQFNINVNAICPGIIWSSMWEKVASRLSLCSVEEKGLSAKEAFEHQVKTRIPLGREQTPEDIGNTIAFLASELAKNITGQAINVNGGIRMN